MGRMKKPPAYQRVVIHGNVRAAVTLSDAKTKRRRTYYLGAYGTDESRERYARVVAQWEADKRRLPQPHQGEPSTGRGPTVTQICHQFWSHAESIYGKSQLGLFRVCVRTFRGMYGETPAVDFGPKSLRLLRNHMVSLKWSRTYVNCQVGLVRHILKWAVSHELIPVSVLEAIRTVEPLKRGKTEAHEVEPVRPVKPEMIAATLPYMNRQVRAIVELQLLTGARPSELLTLRPCDISKKEYSSVWVVRLDDHKTAHHGRERAIYFGPQAQAILKPFMNRSKKAYIFSAAEAEKKRRQQQRRNRKSKVPPSQEDRRKASPVRKPRDRYDATSYRKAVIRACEKAFPPPKPLAKLDGETHAKHAERLERDGLTGQLEEWKKSHRWHPYQLRHNAATTLRHQFGLEAAQLILGHSSAQITDAVYADRDQDKILKIVRKVG